MHHIPRGREAGALDDDAGTDGDVASPRWLRLSHPVQPITSKISAVCVRMSGITAGKRKAERVFAGAHPGFVLRIDKLDYSVDQGLIHKWPD